MPPKSSRPASAPVSRGSSSPEKAQIWEKLSKPKDASSSKEISSLFDEVKNCTFQPTISESAKKLQQPAFQQRVPGYIQRFIELHNQPEKLNNNCTWRPQLNYGKYEEEMKNRGKFLERYKQDIEDRKKKQAELMAKPVATFQPLISSTSKVKAAAITTPFLQRLEEDLAERESNKKTREQVANTLPYTFAPNISKTSREPPNFNAFLARMENDVEEREEKEKDRQKWIKSRPTAEELGKGSNKKKRPSSART